MGKNQHVVPYQKDGLCEEKKMKKSLLLTTHKHKLIQRAKEIAVNQHSEVVIHRSDGTIRDKDSYGNDPCPPKDKKL